MFDTLTDETKFILRFTISKSKDIVLPRYHISLSRITIHQRPIPCTEVFTFLILYILTILSALLFLHPFS